MTRKERAEVVERMEKYLKDIPDYMHGSINAYVLDHQPSLENFLKAVFTNNLVDAVFLADPDNQQAICAYARLLWHGVPRNCWGSDEAVSEWINSA